MFSVNGEKNGQSTLRGYRWGKKKLYMVNLAEFPPLSTSILWENCDRESGCKVFIRNFIQRGAGIMAYRAAAIPEPLCGGRPLV